MLNQIARELFEFQIALPDTPLKSLNCYIIRPEDGGRCLLIDTGFRHPDCWASLRAGMEEAGLRPENTDVFLTHAHADHAGNAADLHALGCRILMSGEDYATFNRWRSERAEGAQPRLFHEGMPAELLQALQNQGPVARYASPWFPATELRDGDVLSYGVYELRCLLMPGHTPGHMCLYDEKRELLFLGDHVLFDITPNICDFRETDDSLRLYLESLRKIAKLPVTLALPGHRSHGGLSVAQRAEQLQAHHRQRLEEALRVVRAAQPIDAYQVAARLSWHIRAASWEDFPLSQKWFAMGETLAHLDYLCDIGALRRHERDGNYYYTAEDTAL